MLKFSAVRWHRHLFDNIQFESVIRTWFQKVFWNVSIIPLWSGLSCISLRCHYCLCTLTPLCQAVGADWQIAPPSIDVFIPLLALSHRWKNNLFCESRKALANGGVYWSVWAFSIVLYDLIAGQDVFPWLQSYKPLYETLFKCWPVTICYFFLDCSWCYCEWFIRRRKNGLTLWSLI